MANYSSESKVADFLDTTIPDGDVSDFLNQADKIINKLTGRNFDADESASARWFKGSDRKVLLIDDCIEITKVEKANDKWGESLTEIDSSDYILVPRNYQSEGIPIKGVYYKHGIFGTGGDHVENHKVTAKWGYSANPPEDIVFAATVITAGLYVANRQEGSVEREKIGNYSVTYGDEAHWASFDRVKEVLSGYKKINL